MSASFSARIIRFLTGSYLKRMDARRADVGLSRRRFEQAARFFIPARGVAVTEVRIGDCDGEKLTPKDADTDKRLLYIHGGAYVMGSARTHRQFVGHVSRAAGVPAVVPNYRLAPENRFPAGLNDVVSAYRALLDEGLAPERIVVAGDSAGGGLAAALLLRLRDEGTPLPAGAVLISPFLDVTASGESARTRAELDPWFRPESIEVVADHYCRPDERRHDYVSPVFAELHGMPPTLIQVGDHEILLSDSERYAARSRSAGNEVRLDVWPEMWHVFAMCTLKMPESRRAIAELGRWIAARLL